MFPSPHGNPYVVADTTKVRIFKQITTDTCIVNTFALLLLIPQRYEFSSKSQLNTASRKYIPVVADTTKVRIFKQITTLLVNSTLTLVLLLIPQRYEFSSKSQHFVAMTLTKAGCCWYHKGMNFQANHNKSLAILITLTVVADTTKVRIFKQITTAKLAIS